MELNSCGTKTDLSVDFFPTGNLILKMMVTQLILINAVMEF